MANLGFKIYMVSMAFWGHVWAHKHIKFEQIMVVDFNFNMTPCEINMFVPTLVKHLPEFFFGVKHNNNTSFG